ncbi:hypothetical protein [Hymenobacter ruber]
MASYSEELARRKQAAADEEAAFVAHFGREAENCANWDDLWQHGWREELVNPAPTATYQPKGLPEDGAGGWVSDDGRQAFADPPSLYSDKFLFHFAGQLVDEEATVAARVSDWLQDADEMDCDQLSAIVGKVATYLANYSLYHVSGTGRNVDMGLLGPERLEAFFQNWDSTKNAAGLFISCPGLAVANRRPVPAVVVGSVLQAVRRQIEARRQQLQTTVFIPAPKEKKGKVSLSTLALIILYKGETVQRGAQANRLAQEAGYASGDSLYNNYCNYSTQENRIGFGNDTARKGRNMIARIQAALPYLDGAAREKAENEINTIEARIS